MFKHGYGIAITAGLLLLLAAGLSLLVPHGNAASGTLDQRLRIQDALADLEPCLTCHSDTAAAARNTLVVARDVNEREAVLAETAPDPLQEQLDARLVALGHRLLKLPEAQANDDQAAALMDRYLQVYDTTRTGADRQVLLHDLSLLDGIEQGLADLEAQAAPVKLTHSVPTAPGCEMLSARTAPPVSPAADSARVAVATTGAVLDVLLENRTGFVQEVSVILVHRRGPPSHGLGVESVL
ncbi:MAG TPA: hypothetical protein PKD09_20015 [Aggregatilinea sp.]|uniref:hypothetical protein n=1 Tax=Aggregatilinea sp. TaxID=2806333 RepID=UPI002B623E1B|nr:hypothetical protein [Aggregatilinea sp.]HML23953.1 hypothetical protein [Aggregatilinea sp.]